MKTAMFKKLHPVRGFCRVPSKTLLARTPLLKFGKIDLPEAVNNRQYCTEVEDQGDKPWCAAYTAAAFAENILWRKTGRKSQIEPEMLYTWAKAHDGDPNGDGTTLDCAANALTAFKLFDPKLCKVRLVGRGWLGTDEADIKATIHRFGCFLGGFNITEEWYGLAQRGITNVIGKKSPTLGGHAVLVVGYNAAGVWIENSWGTDWGDKGFGFIEWKAVRQQFMYGVVLSNVLDGLK